MVSTIISTNNFYTLIWYQVLLTNANNLKTDQFDPWMGLS